jgi:hypothetical protein
MLKKDFIEVHARWPTIREEDWECFKTSCKTPHAKKWANGGLKCKKRTLLTTPLEAVVTKGRDLYGKSRTKNMKRRAYHPYHQFKDHVEHDFVKGRYKYDEKAKCFATDPVTKKVEAELVN